MQIVDGIKFYETNQGYLLGTYKKRPIRMHRYIWAKSNGAIPKGYSVHHKDGNKENNSLDNLVLMKEREHQRFHAKKRDIEELRKYIKKAIEAAPKWHKSKQGKEWHKQHWQNHMADKFKDKVTLVCQVCGKEYQTTPIMVHKSKYCHQNCKATALRRRRKADGKN